ncbi:spermine/spermidine synthase [Cordyceps fumosorosea ARSEF 2679]|uniref:Spermine/spermidine synthase n=1 Tax=Cordyceps fumosorosea (strain ARSEF 2679) TaxID=1081104 RepID=A0A167WIW2_CORFA|nr:spermine/spermidine synthase [Cordyceps fumosorosea ARSEF 2679]OAA63845.1 spermine/spermidine synthase [Cordyceps fumosorosea ARSEF 2679]
MPRKAAAAPAVSRKTASSAAEPSVASSKAQYERELRDLASKAQTDGSQLARLTAQFRQVRSAVTFLFFAGFFAHASQLALAPVYGSIPAATHHPRVLAAAAFAGWAGNLFLARTLARAGGGLSAARLLPVVALSAPLVQVLLEPHSAALGPGWGPLLTEVLTVAPVVLLAAACAADALEGVRVPLLPRFVADALPGMGSWALFAAFEGLAREYVLRFAGRTENGPVAAAATFALTRVGMQLSLGGLMAALAPSAWLLLAAPAVLHTAVLNTHVPTARAAAALNGTLQAHEWLLVDRKESNTGYVSVLESRRGGFRVLRCDHSLLGGEYTDAAGVTGGVVAEPIYGVFAMLEAVRLIETETAVADSDAKALVIGLGIGTTPSALVVHGVDTTVVEIDPVVHAFAKKYFHLRENNEPVLADAGRYTKKLADDPAGKRFDYIVHDVFTGGAEPVELFTLEFLQQLRALLTPHGAIAINYAGDLALPGPRAIVRTIGAVFPACRIFREFPPDTESIAAHGGSDFTNMVIFCKTTPGALTFRKATDADRLNSFARREFLEPTHEVQAAEYLAADAEQQGQTLLLRANDTDIVTQSHKTSARGHWSIMRTVLPGVVWEKW